MTLNDNNTKNNFFLKKKRTPVVFFSEKTFFFFKQNMFFFFSRSLHPPRHMPCQSQSSIVQCIRMQTFTLALPARTVVITVQSRSRRKDILTGELLA